MILQVWDCDGELVINKTVRNENEGLGAGLAYFQQWANSRADEDEDPCVKTRAYNKHPRDRQWTWSIGVAWTREHIVTLYDDGRIVVIEED